MLSYLHTYLLNIIINNNDIYKGQTLPTQQMRPSQPLYDNGYPRTGTFSVVS